MKFQLSCLKILKNEAVKVLHSICQQIWKTQQWAQDWKISLFMPISKKGNAKACSNYHATAIISHASKVMLKILQARLQQYVNREFADIQSGFRKGRGIRDQIANICWIMEKAREFQINIYVCFIDYAKVFDCEFSTVCCDPHSQRLYYSQRSRSGCFSGIPLLSLWSSGCWQFDLWFLCFF